MGDLETVREKILQIFLECFDTQLASADVDLLEGRFVDSLRIVDLVFELEQRFGVTLDFEELEIEDFRTISRLAERLQRAPAAEL
jgi:acyl carrier protein